MNDSDSSLRGQVVNTLMIDSSNLNDVNNNNEEKVNRLVEQSLPAGYQDYGSVQSDESDRDDVLQAYNKEHSTSYTSTDTSVIVEYVKQK